jgi:hypothetical protein
MQKLGYIFVATIAILGMFWSSAAIADPRDLSETEARAAKAQVSLKDCLTHESYQLADELGLLPHLNKLQSLGEHSKHKQGVALSAESATLRLELTELVLQTMLQCQETIAEIESEVSSSTEVKSALENKRDGAVKTNAIANVIANGVIAGAGTMLQMPFETVPDSRYELPGEAVEAAGNLMSGSLGGLAIKQSNGDDLSAAIKPTMLAKIFKRPNDADTEYPDVIWRYLNAVPPSGRQAGLTRRQLLIQRWEGLGRIPSQSTVKGRLYMRALAGTVPLKKKVNIALLTDRIAMLLDLRAEVNQIYKELLNVMLVMRAL